MEIKSESDLNLEVERKEIQFSNKKENEIELKHN